MEIELVLDDVGEVLLNAREVLERTAVIASAQVALRHLELVPHALPKLNRRLI